MSTRKLKILFVTSEVVPFVKTGGLADVSAALSKALTEMGHEVRLVIPKYGAVDERKYKVHDIIRLKDIAVKIGDKEIIFSMKSSFLPGIRTRIQIYFLENYQYFGNRNSLYIDPKTEKEYIDNDERFILFNRAIMEMIIKLGWIPDIVHLNDWQCGLIPAYAKTIYKDFAGFDKLKILFTIHNLSYQGVFPKSSFKKTGLPESLDSEKKGIIHNGKLNFLKTGLLFADTINTVSETYAIEIRTKDDLGQGLKEVFSKRKDKLFGILNGIDTNIWNPEIDKLIHSNYSLKNLDKKVDNKIYLLERFGLKYNPNIPLIGMISRLYDSKGIDLVQSAFNDLMKLNLQFILLGTGDSKYHTFFDKMSFKYPEKFSCYLGFSDELAHMIEAGTDMLLMPSKYEPCGLNQMYSMFYGTIPIVRETGGLADTVVKYDEKTGEGTGFVFKKYEPAEMISEIKRAIKLFSNKDSWVKLIKAAMKKDFSWNASAKKYVELYRKILSED